MAASFTAKTRSIVNKCKEWAQPVLRYLEKKVNDLLPDPSLQPGLEYMRCLRLKQALENCLDPSFEIKEARELLASFRDIACNILDDKAQRYALYLVAAMCTLQHVSLLYWEILERADQIESFVAHWQKRADNPFRNIIEHTPFFWARYYFTCFRAASGAATKPRHPSEEVLQKLAILSKLETIFLFVLGALNYIVTLSKLDSIHDLHIFTGHILRICGDFHENVHGLKTPWFRIDLLSQLDNDKLKLARIFSLAEIQFENSARFKDEIAPIWHRVKIPPSMARHWFYYCFAGLVIVGASRYASTHEDEVSKFFIDVKAAARGFYDNQVKGVIKGIWDTIRYEEDEEILKLKQRAVKASEDSLGRMVLEYNLEKFPPVSAESVEKIRIAAEHGDLSTIMPFYENEMENPLKNAVFGDFVRLALIQVQKQKVDIENAMLQIDKLLRSNELNFKILAAAPAIVLAVLLIGFLTRERQPKRIHNEIRKTVRMTHALLTRYKGEEQRIGIESDTEREPLVVGGIEVGLDCVSYGRIMHKTLFQEDLHQIETEAFTVDQRLLTLNRMYQTYPFLQLR